MLAVRLASAMGVPDRWVTVPLLAVLPWVVLLLWVAVAVGMVVAFREPAARRLAIALLVVAVAGAVVVVPRTVALEQPSATGREITLAVINVRRGLADPARIAEVVESTGTDVLVVIELTAEFDVVLRRAGVGQRLPSAVVAPTGTTAGGGVYADADLRARRPPEDGGDTPDVIVTFEDASVLDLTTTHPVPPIGPRRTSSWTRGLARIGTAPEDGVAIVAGDLNATLDHAGLRDLLADGWRDAAREAGAGLTVTYDGVLDGSPGLPMAIDHVLVNAAVAVRAARSYDIPGTDHRMLVVDLQLPEPAGE